MLIDQGYETFSGSTGNDWIGSSLSFRAYATEGLISINMANYIRRLGYPARAHHGPYNYQVAMPPLVLLAGLGEVSRTGVVLNPFLGLRFKACAVTTDLPLTPDKPIDFGLQKFCQYCKKCARECPPNAISVGDKVMYNGYETWKLKVERCSIYRITNRKGSACSRCIKVCPWNKPQGWTHDVTRWMVRHSPFLDRFVIKMDDVWGYGKQKIEDKWWFDLEEIDGILRVAGHSGKPE
jgi:reductive dehalogenase